jgi:hypothetical protein
MGEGASCSSFLSYMEENSSVVSYINFIIHEEVIPP